MSRKTNIQTSQTYGHLSAPFREIVINSGSLGNPRLGATSRSSNCVESPRRTAVRLQSPLSR
jgi:hypothetical protein